MATAAAWWSDLGNLLTGIGTLLLVIVGLVAGVFAYRQLRDARAARQVSIVTTYYEWFRSRQAEDAKDLLVRESNKACHADQFPPNMPHYEDRLLRSYFGHHEYLAILADRGIADRGLLQPLLGRASYEAWCLGLVYIARRRMGQQINRRHYCMYLERVLREWVEDKGKESKAWRESCDIEGLPRSEDAFGMRLNRPVVLGSLVLLPTTGAKALVWLPGGC